MVLRFWTDHHLDCGLLPYERVSLGLFFSVIYIRISFLFTLYVKEPHW